MNRKTGWIWMLAGILMALLAGFLTFRTLASASVRASLEREDIPTTPVVVAVRTIPLNRPIGAEDIALRNVPNELVPSGAVRTLESALGRIATTELHAGEILLEQRLVHPDKVVEDALAFAIPEGYVVIALPPSDLMSSLGILQAGDKVDILVSLEVPGTNLASQDETTNTNASTDLVTFNAIQNLEITALAMGSIPQANTQGDLGFGGGGANTTVEFGVPTALLFAVTPQDALILKYVQDAGGIIDLALRAPDDDQFMEVDPVTIKYLSELYRMDIPVSPEPRSESQTSPANGGQ